MVYDVGRGLRPLSAQGFLDMETGASACPFPKDGHAWFALVFWQARAESNISAQQFVWFLKLPIDESSHLLEAPRMHFVEQVVQALQAGLDQPAPPSVENTYIFVPSDTLRAQLNARVQFDLEAIDHRSCSAIRSYIEAPGAADWRVIPQQELFNQSYSIAQDEDLIALLSRHWLMLAPQFKHALLAGMAVAPQNESLLHFLLSQLRLTTDKSEQTQLFWALMNAGNEVQTKAIVSSLLQTPDFWSSESITALTDALGHSLSPGMLGLLFGLLSAFNVPEESRQDLLTAIYRDLVRIPAIRNFVLKLLQTQ